MILYDLWLFSSFTRCPICVNEFFYCLHLYSFVTSLTECKLHDANEFKSLYDTLKETWIAQLEYVFPRDRW